MDVFPLVNRCAVALKPRQPFLDWLKKTEPSVEMSLEELRKDGNLYLVPDYEEAGDIENAIQKYIKSNYQEIFISELTAWYMDADLFPEVNYANFHEWFDITNHPMIFDMVNEPLDKD